LIIENYTWNEVARKLVQNYQEILKTWKIKLYLKILVLESY
jgi:hypothetical protein